LSIWPGFSCDPEALGDPSVNDRLRAYLEATNEEVWLHGWARVYFTAESAPLFPIIADPYARGVLTGPFDPDKLAYWAGRACEDKWNICYREQPASTAVINVPSLGDATLGITGNDLPPKSTLCNVPRQPAFKQKDVLSEYVVIDNRGKQLSKGNMLGSLAHELGHTFLLGHGDGVDNDFDGSEPPTPGFRSFDEYCDPLGYDDAHNQPVEDLQHPTGSCGSLMNAVANGCEQLTPLQIETIHDIAPVFPGAAPGDPACQVTSGFPCLQPPCGVAPDTYLGALDITDDVATATTTFAHRTSGPLTLVTAARYWVFANQDGDPSTGCAPSTLGAPTGFQGAELVTSVTVQPGQSPAARVWRCQSGALTEVNDPGIQATIQNGWITELARTGPGKISLDVPDAVRGPVADGMRVEALAEQLAPGTDVSRLPAGTDGGVGCRLAPPPPAPQCSIDPILVHPGQSTTVTATGLPAGALVDLVLAGQPLSVGTLVDNTGQARIGVVIPANLAPQFHAATVVVQGSGVHAICHLRAVPPALTASTGAQVSPSPNGLGWNSTGVTVSLAATDKPYGVGVQSISYSAAGAQSIAGTTVAGASASFMVDAEGVTTVAYDSTDNAGTVETSETLVVRIDETRPTITGAASPAANSYGWNNTTVTVSFQCQDALSGIASCGPTVFLSQEGAAQSAAGQAADRADNNSSATVSGINIDEAKPTVAFSGDQATYAVDETVDITCAASDALSGIATSDCPQLQAPAYTFGLGSHSFTATATDRAGNVASATATFQVIVTFDSLCHLTEQLLANAAIAHSLCVKLEAGQLAQMRGNRNAAAGTLGAFENEVRAHQGKLLTTAQADLLIQLAHAL
jgi:hypothetical protein